MGFFRMRSRPPQNGDPLQDGYDTSGRLLLSAPAPAQVKALPPPRHLRPQIPGRRPDAPMADCERQLKLIDGLGIESVQNLAC
jgi:hypothetical protein